MSIEYKIDDIKKLLKKIENVTNDRIHVEKIKEIILKENPNLSITKKSSGILLFFHNLSQNTYKRLDLYFQKLEDNKILNISSILSDNNPSSTNSDEVVLNSDDVFGSPKIKLSNNEKKILKKKQYHKDINNDNNTDIYIMSEK